MDTKLKCYKALKLQVGNTEMRLGDLIHRVLNNALSTAHITVHGCRPLLYVSCTPALW